MMGKRSTAAMLALILLFNVGSAAYLFLSSPVFSGPSAGGPGPQPDIQFLANKLGRDEDDNLSKSSMAIFLSHMARVSDEVHMESGLYWPPALEFGRKAIQLNVGEAEPSEEARRRGDVVLLEGLPFEANSEEMTITDLRADFMDTADRCSQKEISANVVPRVPQVRREELPHRVLPQPAVERGWHRQDRAPECDLPAAPT